MDLATLKQQRMQIVGEMQALSARMKTPEDKKKFDELDQRQMDLQTQIMRKQNYNDHVSRGRENAFGAQGEADERGRQESADEQRYHQAWTSFLRHGLVPSSDGRQMGIRSEDREILEARGRVIERIEARDMGEGIGNVGAGTGGGAYPGSSSGFFVPVGFSGELEKALKYYGPMWNSSRVYPTATGGPLPWPTENDTTISGERVGENQQVSTNDVSLSQLMMSAIKYSSKLVRVSIELLQDSAFDIDAFLLETFGTRLGRVTNADFTNGGGLSAQSGSPLTADPQPSGIVPESVVGLSSGTTPSIIGDDNQTTPDPTQQVGYIDLVNLEHSVDLAYRTGASFMMHDSTLRYIKTLKDKFGHPLWMSGFAIGKPDTILGYPYWVNNDMPTLAAGKKVVLFGRMDKYLIRRVRQMSVLRLVERYAEFGQVGFLAFMRCDGRLLDAGTNPVKHILTHA